MAAGSHGWYYVQLNATDTATAGPINFHIEVDGCREVDLFGYVLPANIYDSWLGTDKQQVDVMEVGGTAQTANDNGADINAVKAITDTVVADTLTALKASTGYTAGGATTFAEAVKILLAAAAGQVDASGSDLLYRDIETVGTTISTVTPSASDPYRSVVIT